MKSQNPATVEQLLGNPTTNVTEEGPGGWTPFMQASDDGNLEVVIRLLESRADVAHVNRRKGRSALSFAVFPSMGRQPMFEIVTQLLSHNANHLQDDHDGFTPLDWAEYAVTRATTDEGKTLCRSIVDAFQH